jgi:hypothetical protein
MRSYLNLTARFPALFVPPAPLSTTRLKPKSNQFSPWIAILLGFLAISMTGSVLIDSEMEGLYRAVFSYFALPIFFGCYAVAWFVSTFREAPPQGLKGFCWTGVCALCLLFTCGGIANYANALLGSGQNVRFSGAVTKLDYSTGKGGAHYYVVIRDDSSGRRAKFQVSLSDYSRLKPGDHFDCSMKLGGLGYGYRWNL